MKKSTALITATAVLAIATTASAKLTAGSITSVGTGNSSKSAPAVTGTKIIWAETNTSVSPNTYTIQMFDTATGIQKQLSAPNTGAKKTPIIVGNKAFWTDNRTVTQQIYSYDLTTNTEAPVDSINAGQVFLSGYGDTLVFSNLNTNNNYDIFTYNLTSKVKTPLNASSANQIAPAIYGNKIVWQESVTTPVNPNGATNGIVLYDLTTGASQMISNQAANNAQPTISGNTVTWGSDPNNCPEPGCSDWNIMSYDLLSGTTTGVVTAAGDQANPSISGSTIAFQDYKAFIQTSVYDMTDNTVTQITSDSADKTKAAIDGNLLAWSDTGLIYYTKLSSGTQPPSDTIAPTISSTSPANGATGVSTTTSATVTLSENVLQGATFNSITLKKGSTTVSATTSISGNKLTIKPARNLSGRTVYTVTVPAGAVKDAADNSLISATTFSFTTK